jgi:hypothetical protein
MLPTSPLSKQSTFTDIFFEEMIDDNTAFFEIFFRVLSPYKSRRTFFSSDKVLMNLRPE